MAINRGINFNLKTLTLTYVLLVIKQEIKQVKVKKLLIF